MKYVFKFYLSTDGDFGMDYVPLGMEYDGCEEFSLEKEFNDKNKAIAYIKKTCNYIKNNIHCVHDFALEDLKDMLDRFCKDLEENPDKGYYSDYMSGNYDGTEITFKEVPNIVKFEFSFTDEEYELFKKAAQTKLITNKDLKNIIMNEFKRIVEEDKNGN